MDIAILLEAMNQSKVRIVRTKALNQLFSSLKLMIANRVFRGPRRPSVTSNNGIVT